MKRSRKKLSILLIDDKEEIAKLVSIYLREAKIKSDLHHKQTLYEGSDFAEEEQPDLVLLDLSLPDSRGFKTVSTFLERNPRLPVIVMTSIDDETIGNQAVKAGAQDFLVKGEFDGRLFGRVVRYALERHKSQQQLADTAKDLSISERRYLEAQKMANFGSFELDLVDNTMVWSEEFYGILGFHKQSIDPKLTDYLNCCHFEDRNMVSQFFEEASQDGKRHTLEHRIILDGRKIRYMLLHAKVFYDDINEKFFLVGTIQDITERKLGQQLIEEKNLKSHSSRFREEMLGEMGFNIRTPLTSLQSIAYVLSLSEQMKKEAEMMDGLKESLEDLSGAVNSLLNFSMLLSEKIAVDETDIVLKEFVQQVRQMVQLKAKQTNTQLNFHLSEDLPDRFKGDSNKIVQILYNLIDNGIKFTDENGRVDISLSMVDGKDENFDLVMSVKDDGKGIPKEKVGRMMKSNLLQQPEEGLRQPMGLAIVNKLLDVMKGSLEIVSEEGKGATFTVTVPARSIAPIELVDGKPNQPLRILLVEDHFLNQIATRKVLTSWSEHVSVDIAENGQVGVDKFRANEYDVVLMDIQMPIMDGFEAARNIRDVSQVPILALTANSSKAEAQKSKELGMDYYMSKPFKPLELYRNIMTVLQKRGEGIAE